MATSEHGSLARRLLGRVVSVRDEEVAPLLWSCAYFFCLLCSYMILRPLRDAMGIAAGVENLQWLFTATFFGMLVAVPLFSALVSRLGRRRFIPVVYHFFAANLLVFYVLWGGLDEGAKVHVARAFYVWISVFNLFVVTVFWGVMADLFRQEQGRRLFGFIAVGGSLGALVGPSLTAVLVERIGTANLLLISVAFLELGIVCARQVLRRAPHAHGPDDEEPTDDAPVGGGMLDGFKLVFRSPYLLAIAGYVALLSLGGTFLYFEQANVVKQAVEGNAARTALFARMDLAVNVLALVLQGAVVARLIRWLGLGKTLAILPLVGAVGFALLGSHLVLWTIVVFQVVFRATSFGTSGPAREVLFTVVSREEKYKSKSFLDTVVQRGGDVVSGWAFAGLGAIGLSLSGLALVMVPFMLAWTGLGLYLGRHVRAASTD